MRINIIRRPEQARAGYMNVSDKVEELPEFEFTNVENTGCLKTISLPGELSELVATDVLDQFAPEAADAVLDHWISMVGIGGTIAITCIDLVAVAQDLVVGRLNAAQANEILHGDGRRASYSLTVLAEAIAARGLKVIRRNIHGHQCCVVAKRES